MRVSLLPRTSLTAWLASLLSLLPTATAQASVGVTTDHVIEEVAVIAARIEVGPLAGLVPEIVFDRLQLDALSASSLDELMQEIQSDLEGAGSDNRARVILANGKVIASFADIRTFPQEAIERVEIYPEEVALRYGFRATQKVINFVFQSKFSAWVGRSRGRVSTSGGGESGSLETGYVSLHGDRRLSLNLQVERAQALHDSDRSVSVAQDGQPFSFAGNVFAAAGGEIDPQLSMLAQRPVTAATLPSSFEQLTPNDLLASANQPVVLDELSSRTLLPEQRTTHLSVSYAQGLWDSINLTASAGYSQQRTRAEQGLAGFSLSIPNSHPLSPFANDVQLNRAFPVELERTASSDTYEAGTSIAGQLGAWTWSWLTNFSQTIRAVETDRNLTDIEFGVAVANGDPAFNPFASPTNLTLLTDSDGTENRDLTSRLNLNGVIYETQQGPLRAAVGVEWRNLERDSDTQTNGSLSETALSREARIVNASLDIPLTSGSRLGRFAANLNGEFARFSDFGDLSVLGTGLSWRLNKRLRVRASFTREQSAPGIAQLGDAVSRLPNRRVFDFVTGDSVNATFVTGGNPQLDAAVQRSARLNLRAQPFGASQLKFVLDYADIQTDNPIVAFPTPNAQLENTFPTRFARDISGTLIEFDSRPINLRSAVRREVRWGLRYAKNLAGTHQRNQVAEGRRDGRSSRDRGRLRLSLNHTIVLQDELSIAAQIPTIDFVGISNAGRLRDGVEHLVNLRTVFSRHGLAASLDLNWQSATESLTGPAGALTYADLSRVDLNLSYTVKPQSSLAQRFPLLASARIRMTLDNVFNTLPEVSDASGATPPGFSGDELAPLARAIHFEIRKLFR